MNEIRLLHGTVQFQEFFTDGTYGDIKATDSADLAGCGAALAMLLIGIWSFLRTKDRFILYI